MYHKTTLENGLRVVTESMAEVRTVSIGIIIDASPRHEAAGHAGLAHLTEHALFQGTSSRDALQIARLMDTAGGHIGACTTRDYTCYHATVLDDYHTYALDLFGDLLLNSTFPAENLEREKRSILREIDARRDSPRDHVATLLRSIAWPTHPAGRPIAGMAETVQGLSREDVIYFMHDHYLPDRMIIAAAGHIEHADFVAQVRDAFWRLLGKGQPPRTVGAERCSGVVCEFAPVSQAYFALGLPAHPYAHADRHELHVLNALLGGGISSRLFRKVREERGLVYDIGSEYQALRDAGLLIIEGSTAPEHLLAVLDLVFEVLWGLASWEEPISEEELWKAKMQLRSQHSIGGESTHTRMSRLAIQEFYFGRRISTEEVLAQLDAVDAERLRTLAKESLEEALRFPAVAVVGPDTQPYYNQGQIAALLADRAGRSREEILINS